MADIKRTANSVRKKLKTIQTQIEQEEAQPEEKQATDLRIKKHRYSFLLLKSGRLEIFFWSWLLVAFLKFSLAKQCPFGVRNNSFKYKTSVLLNVNIFLLLFLYQIFSVIFCTAKFRGFHEYIPYPVVRHELIIWPSSQYADFSRLYNFDRYCPRIYFWYS